MTEEKKSREKTLREQLQERGLKPLPLDHPLYTEGFRIGGVRRLGDRRPSKKEEKK